MKKSYGDPAKYITHLHVAEDCIDHPYAVEIIRRASLPVSVVKAGEQPKISGCYPANLGQGKHHLFLCRQLGPFYKKCPGTREYTCCGYKVLNVGMNCPMDCVYCILQAYLNNPWISFFVNIEDLFTELDELFATNRTEFFRIGTGEFTDSLALDSITRLSPRLVEYMRDKPLGILELKSKSVVIDYLKNLRHNGRTVLSWSLNSQQVMAKEELRAATLDERLNAAARAAEWGYLLAFHFDPIIYHEHWREGYQETIEKLFARVPAENIVWISMGALRYLPSLKEIASQRFPASRFFFEEFVMGLDGKCRYFRPQRVAMYQFILGQLRRHVQEHTCIYFCMESGEIWQEVFGYRPEEFGGLPAMLDRSVGSLA